MSHLTIIDVEKIKQTAYKYSMRKVKRQIIEEGFTNQITVYGVLNNKPDNTNTRRRIDAYMKEPYTQNTFNFIVNLFTQFPPPFEYSLWTYQPEDNKIELRWRTP